MAGKLELALEFLMGNARAAEIGVRLTHAPIGKGGRAQGESEQQACGDQELRLVTHLSLKI
jgi:hypothetical protein